MDTLDTYRRLRTYTLRIRTMRTYLRFCRLKYLYRVDGSQTVFAANAEFYCYSVTDAQKHIDIDKMVHKINLLAFQI